MFIPRAKLHPDFPPFGLVVEDRNYVIAGIVFDEFAFGGPAAHGFEFIQSISPFLHCYVL